jgi:hypothetical protein
MTQQETKAVKDAAVNQNTYVESEIVDAFIAGAQFLDELRNQSEPETNVGEAGEELAKRICEVLDVWERTDIDGIHSNEFNQVATEIAALMQPDKELLEALKETDKDLCVLESTMLQIEQRDHLAEGMAELVKKWRARNKQAISNYEKQSK